MLDKERRGKKHETSHKSIQTTQTAATATTASNINIRKKRFFHDFVKTGCFHLYIQKRCVQQWAAFFLFSDDGRYRWAKIPCHMTINIFYT